jgi:hypothetical protein
MLGEIYVEQITVIDAEEAMIIDVHSSMSPIFGHVPITYSN